MAIAGRHTDVFVSTDDITYNVVDDLNLVDQTDEAEQLDSTKFGASRRTFLPGFPGGNWGLGGFYNTADTLGQRVLEDAYDDGSDVYIKVLYDGISGWRQRVKVSNFTKHSGVGEIVSVVITLLPQADPIRTP